MTHLISSDHHTTSTPVMAWAATRTAQDPATMILPADPLDDDQPDDLITVLSHRQLGRLVFVAAETGARLAREGSPHDPAAWMAAPRRLFGGSNAITACANREMFIRAVVLHGVSSAYDMAPEDMDLLLEESTDVTDDVREAPSETIPAGQGSNKFKLVRTMDLYTATAVEEATCGVTHVFYAAVAASEDDVRDQLRSRAGARVAYMADVQLGFDPSEPVAMSLLSEVMGDLVAQIASAPTSPLSKGFKLFIEHRFDD